MAYLAGDKSIEASLDLSDRFRPEGGGDPLLPRYACAPGDDDPAAAEKDPAERFAERPPIRLVESFRPADGRDEVRIRVAGIDHGRGRREAALVRIAALEPGPGFVLTLE